MDDEETFSVIRGLGECLVQRKQAHAASFLATTPGSGDEGKAVRALLGNSTSCTPRNSRLSLPRDIIRGAVAEAMYRRSYRAAPPVGESGAVRPAGALDLAEFSRCVVLSSPQEVHALITGTLLGSREEYDAVVRFAPQMQQCLPKSKSPQMVAPLVRLALADALYGRALRVSPPQPRVR
jgi:hypothetical protein